MTSTRRKKFEKMKAHLDELSVECKWSQDTQVFMLLSLLSRKTGVADVVTYLNACCDAELDWRIKNA